MERVAVIGMGNIAVRHRRNLKALFPDAILYAMSASGRVPEEHLENVDIIVSNVEELISNDIQLVVVASPASHHLRHAIALIKSGVPILIEKPITSFLTDAFKIKEAEEHFNTPVSVGYCLRYLPSAQKMKAYIDECILGDLYNVTVEIGQYLPDWRPSKDYRNSVSASVELGGGALLELSHELDYVQWMLGTLSVKHAILRSSSELGLDVEDSVDILATAKKNIVVNIHLDFLQKTAFRQCRFVGSKGVIIWDLIRNQIQMTSKEGAVLLYQDTDWDKNQMYLEMIIDFVRMIQGLGNQSIRVSESIGTLTLIEEIKNDYQIYSCLS